jgi:hypothetical protein
VLIHNKVLIHNYNYGEILSKSYYKGNLLRVSCTEDGLQRAFYFIKTDICLKVDFGYALLISLNEAVISVNTSIKKMEINTYLEKNQHFYLI